MATRKGKLKVGTHKVRYITSELTIVISKKVDQAKLERLYDLLLTVVDEVIGHDCVTGHAHYNKVETVLEDENGKEITTG